MIRRPPRSTLFPYTTLFRSGREEPLLQQLVDLFDGMELLVEGEVAGELVTPVRYLYYRPRLGLELLGVYLDHPDLVWPLVGELPDRGVLREDAVPVGPPVAGAHRSEERRDGRRGEYGFRGDPVSSTVDCP